MKFYFVALDKKVLEHLPVFWTKKNAQKAASELKQLTKLKFNVVLGQLKDKLK